MMKKTLFLLFISFYSILFSQIDKQLLEGDWIVYNKQLSDGSKYFSQLPSSNPHKIYYFKKREYFTKEYITDPNSFINFPIKIKDSTIISEDNPHFKIEKLTSDELILLDVNDKKSEKIFVRYFLTRYTTARKNDLEKNSNQQTLNSTPALSPYPKGNLFENEFKSDKEQPFKTKGYLLFDLEKKSIQTTLVDTSDIPLETQRKLKKIFEESYENWDFSKIGEFKHIKLPFIAKGYKLEVNVNIYSNISVGYNISDYDQIILPLDTQKIINAEKYNEFALKCFEKKDYNCSLENFKKSFLQNKYNLDAHYNYATINLALEKKDLACQKWKELIEYGQKEAEKEFFNNKCEN